MYGTLNLLRVRDKKKKKNARSFYVGSTLYFVSETVGKILMKPLGPISCSGP